MYNQHNLSSVNRIEKLSAVSDNIFDLIIIGGGITGAGIALDAASRGFKVALFEKQDFAAGTSSRSTKLIHGGLRYLKNFEFSLVHEVGKERAILYRNAPHLVRPEKMLLPVIKHGTYKKWQMNFGLWLYDFLSGVKKEEWHKILSKKEMLQLEPLLTKSIKGGGVYYEYQTNDGRLVIEVIKTALTYNAFCFNYMEATDFIYTDQHVAGVKVKDVFTAETFEFKAKYVINATGPWVDKIRSIDGKVSGHRLHHTKGVHIVFTREKLPIKHSVYADVGDGRMVFAIPYESCTYVGTTDTNYAGNLENPEINKDDVNYLLDAINKIFPGQIISANDIVSSWAGIRPLIHEEGKPPSEISRKDEIFVSDSGIISITGGKLTGYRKMAEKIVDLVCQKEGKEIECKTKEINISGGPKANEKNVLRDKDKIFYKRYGSNAPVILKYLKENIDASYLNAELWYAVNYEAVCTISDFLIRRTGLLYFEPQKINDLLNPVADIMQELLNWDDDTKQKNLEEFQKERKVSLVFPG